MDFELQRILVEIAIGRGLSIIFALMKVAVVFIGIALLTWVWLRK